MEECASLHLKIMLADFKETVYFYHLVLNSIVVRLNDKALKSLKDSKNVLERIEPDHKVNV